jgi:hypothetical protein
LSVCERRWLKAATIIGNTLQALEQRQTERGDDIADVIGARLAVLVGRGQFDAQGDIKKRRYSEVRLPPAI